MEFDISPIINETNVLFGVLAPFVTALLVQARTSESLKGMVSIVYAGVVAFIINATGAVELEVNEIVNQATGVLAISLTSWLLVFKAAAARLNEKTAYLGIGDLFSKD